MYNLSETDKWTYGETKYYKIPSGIFNIFNFQIG